MSEEVQQDDFASQIRQFDFALSIRRRQLKIWRRFALQPFRFLNPSPILISPTHSEIRDAPFQNLRVSTCFKVISMVVVMTVWFGLSWATYLLRRFQR
jgi:hypothetical protein